MRPSIQLATNRAQLRALASSFGFEDVLVFGSASREEDREDSDLDLLIQIHDDEKAFFPAFSLIAQMGKQFPQIRLDAVVDVLVKPAVLAAAKRDGFIL